MGVNQFLNVIRGFGKSIPVKKDAGPWRVLVSMAFLEKPQIVAQIDDMRLPLLA
jgi:hypothetical protein